MKYIKIFAILLCTSLYFSCTKLDENFRGELSQTSSSSITAAELLTSAYNGAGQPFMTGDFWHLQQHSTDETIGPTRAGDWDDNGQWRALHAHTWNADHGIVSGAFSALLGSQFAASNVLQFNPSAQQAAEARFLRALVMWGVLDGWNQVPYRSKLGNYKDLPETLKGKDAADLIISELNAILNDLPSTGPAYQATKNAARVLLMKLYLNYGVYTDRKTPSWPADKMALVISLANQITGYTINSGKYFDNFAPNNDAVSTENIFTFYNQNGVRGGNVRGAWFSIAHYNMNPSGWNGFATLSDFYDKFTPGDERLGKKYVYPGSLPNPGNRRNVGFLIGQQYNLTTDAALKTRQDNPLVFTKTVALRETNANTLELTGIRVSKYPYDYATSADQTNNDWVLFRYADVILMKAEALLKTGNATGARDLINTEIRAKRGAANLTTLDDTELLNERGRELYWEGWRRNDLIRFGKYLAPWQEKSTDDPKNLFFPIPNNQLAVNPNLTQNPGYK